MKQKDLLLIALIVVISATASYIISSKVFASPKNRKTQVEVVEPITTQFAEPNKKYFNEKSVNPTQTIQIGGSDNQNPLENQAQ